MSRISLDSNTIISKCYGIIIASALEANCDILYSENMHNGLIIENSLKIVNPFI